MNTVADQSLSLFQQAIVEAHDSILEQSRQVQRLSQFVDNGFKEAVKSIHSSKGRLVISGMGKSGLIGKKIAATMASTGTSSFFVHPGEAYHGDLGMIQPEDVVLLLTNSGETDEVIKLIPSLKQFGNKIIGMTGNLTSTLAKHADIVLNVSVEREVCPNNLAPTASTTAALVMGDALAVALIHLSNFQPKDFARFHPGGSLGRKLLTRVKDVMIQDDLPIVAPSLTMNDVIMVMTKSRLGLAIVMDKSNLLGVITDGDLRRALAAGTDFSKTSAQQMMTKDPVTIFEDAMLADGEEHMRRAQVKQIIVTNSESQVKGVLEFFQ
ncbi:SIS domain-containing protein [Bermanella sp. R86510]|uniref:KpsF/GutQ family sugar-phosphate isomerase n=1 Tax=unclassified Bermanella TaxID=2627862 RepID=UPI0037C9145D